jgi:prolyl-tRNA synthetase
MVESSFIVRDILTTETFLSTNGISFTTVRHDPVMTIPDMLEKVKFEGD